MKSIFNYCLLLCVAFASCTEIYFKEPQPKGIKPLDNGLEELTGVYISFDDDSEEEDTVIVSRDEITFTGEEESLDEELGELMVVKKYKRNFFLNFYNSDMGLWQLIVVKKVDPDSLVVINMTSLEKEDAEKLGRKKYGKKIKKEPDDEYIVLDPSRRKLMKLMDYPIFDENKIRLKNIRFH